MIKLVSYDSEAVWYRPDFHDNREESKKNPMRVLLEPMSGAEYRRIEEQHGGVKKGGVNFTHRHNVINADVIRQRVKEIENCSVDVVGKDRVRTKANITTPGDLLKYAGGAEDLLQDIVNAIRDHSLLEEGLEKKSDSRSDSSTLPVTRSAAGGVPDATPQSSQDKRETLGVVTPSNTSGTRSSEPSATVTGRPQGSDSHGHPISIAAPDPN
jgi:hypothetical protein